MKKFNLLGIIAILAIAAVFILSFEDTFNDCKEGWEDANNDSTEVNANPKDTNKSSIKSTYQVNVFVEPIKQIDECYVNKVNNESIKYSISKINTRIEPSTLYNVLDVFLLISGIMTVYGVYLLIRALISISKHDVFTRKNVYRIRMFIYSCSALRIIYFIQQMIIEKCVLEQVTIPGYNVIGISDAHPDWIALIIMVLLAEIFAVGVKIKEEQDLTI